MKTTCPHCGSSVSEPWHRSYGLQKIEKGWVELGVQVVGRANFRREAIGMVYMCELANLPFLVVIPDAKKD